MVGPDTAVVLVSDGDDSELQGDAGTKNDEVMFVSDTDDDSELQDGAGTKNEEAMFILDSGESDDDSETVSEDDSNSDSGESDDDSETGSKDDSNSDSGESDDDYETGSKDDSNSDSGESDDDYETGSEDDSNSDSEEVDDDSQAKRKAADGILNPPAAKHAKHVAPKESETGSEGDSQSDSEEVDDDSQAKRKAPDGILNPPAAKHAKHVAPKESETESSQSKRKAADLTLPVPKRTKERGTQSKKRKGDLLEKSAVAEKVDKEDSTALATLKDELANTTSIPPNQILPGTIKLLTAQIECAELHNELMGSPEYVKGTVKDVRRKEKNLVDELFVAAKRKQNAAEQSFSTATAAELKSHALDLLTAKNVAVAEFEQARLRAQTIVGVKRVKQAALDAEAQSTEIGHIVTMSHAEYKKLDVNDRVVCNQRSQYAGRDISCAVAFENDEEYTTGMRRLRRIKVEDNDEIVDITWIPPPPEKAYDHIKVLFHPEVDQSTKLQVVRYEKWVESLFLQDDTWKHTLFIKAFQEAYNSGVAVQASSDHKTVAAHKNDYSVKIYYNPTSGYSSTEKEDENGRSFSGLSRALRSAWDLNLEVRRKKLDKKIAKAKKQQNEAKMTPDGKKQQEHTEKKIRRLENSRINGNPPWYDSSVEDITQKVKNVLLWQDEFFVNEFELYYRHDHTVSALLRTLRSEVLRSKGLDQTELNARISSIAARQTGTVVDQPQLDVWSGRIIAQCYNNNGNSHVPGHSSENHVAAQVKEAFFAKNGSAATDYELLERVMGEYFDSPPEHFSAFIRAIVNRTFAQPFTQYEVLQTDGHRELYDVKELEGVMYLFLTYNKYESIARNVRAQDTDQAIATNFENIKDDEKLVEELFQTAQAIKATTKTVAALLCLTGVPRRRYDNGLFILIENVFYEGAWRETEDKTFETAMAAISTAYGGWSVDVHTGIARITQALKIDLYPMYVEYLSKYAAERTLRWGFDGRIQVKADGMEKHYSTGANGPEWEYITSFNAEDAALTELYQEAGDLATLVSEARRKLVASFSLKVPTAKTVQTKRLQEFKDAAASYNTAKTAFTEANGKLDCNLSLTLTDPDGSVPVKGTAKAPEPVQKPAVAAAQVRAVQNKTMFEDWTTKEWAQPRPQSVAELAETLKKLCRDSDTASLREIVANVAYSVKTRYDYQRKPSTPAKQGSIETTTNLAKCTQKYTTAVCKTQVKAGDVVQPTTGTEPTVQLTGLTWQDYDNLGIKHGVVTSNAAIGRLSLSYKGAKIELCLVNFSDEKNHKQAMPYFKENSESGAKEHKDASIDLTLTVYDGRAPLYVRSISGAGGVAECYQISRITCAGECKVGESYADSILFERKFFERRNKAHSDLAANGKKRKAILLKHFKDIVTAPEFTIASSNAKTGLWTAKYEWISKPVEEWLDRKFRDAHIYGEYNGTELIKDINIDEFSKRLETIDDLQKVLALGYGPCFEYPCVDAWDKLEMKFKDTSSARVMLMEKVRFRNDAEVLCTVKFGRDRPCTRELEPRMHGERPFDATFYYCKQAEPETGRKYYSEGFKAQACKEPEPVGYNRHSIEAKDIACTRPYQICKSKRFGNLQPRYNRVGVDFRKRDPNRRRATDI